MELTDEFKISLCEPIAPLGDREDVALVKDRTTQRLYVKKTLRVYDARVYSLARDNPHPNVIRIEAVYEGEHGLEVLEEYFAGETVGDLLGRGPLPEDRAVEIALALCEALGHLHRLGIIHRDIKPSNVMVDESGRVKLLDFDVSRIYGEQVSRDTRVLGTAGYAPPEQFGFKQTDARSDIYSLGVLLRCMLTGNAEETGDYSGRLAPVIARCTAFAPEERYGSVAELETALRQGNARREQQALWPPPGFRSGTPWKMVVGALGYVLIFWIVFFLMQPYPGETVPGNILMMALDLGVCLYAVALAADYGGIQSSRRFLRSVRWPKRILAYVYHLVVLVLVWMLLFVAVAALDDLVAMLVNA